MVKLTKYEHACLVLQNQGKTLVIDPGEFSPGFPLDATYDYVIVTHEHADHLSADKLKAIYLKNPSVHFFVNQKLYDENLRKLSPLHTIIDAGVTASVDGFELSFFGHDHAVIYKTSPCLNNGVLVNGTFYYPGDSLVLPDAPIKLLAVPAAAPWLKTSEAMDFVKAVKPKQAFLTHDAMLSDVGHLFTSGWVKGACSEVGAELIELKPGATHDF